MKHVKGYPVSPHTYGNKKCRCDGCVQARSIYMKELRSRPYFRANEERRNTARRLAFYELRDNHYTEYRKIYLRILNGLSE